jgi:hypothetical protein
VASEAALLEMKPINLTLRSPAIGLAKWSPRPSQKFVAIIDSTKYIRTRHQASERRTSLGFQDLLPIQAEAKLFVNGGWQNQQQSQLLYAGDRKLRQR